MASGKARPMMPLIAASSRCGRSQLCAATRIDSTMRAMESTSVPSQSNIRTSYLFTQPLQRPRPDLIDRRLQRQFAAIGQRHPQGIGMQEQALTAELTDLA